MAALADRPPMLVMHEGWLSCLHVKLGAEGAAAWFMDPSPPAAGSTAKSHSAYLTPPATTLLAQFLFPCLHPKHKHLEIKPHAIYHFWNKKETFAPISRSKIVLRRRFSFFNPVNWSICSAGVVFGLPRSKFTYKIKMTVCKNKGKWLQKPIWLDKQMF